MACKWEKVNVVSGSIAFLGIVYALESLISHREQTVGGAVVGVGETIIRRKNKEPVYVSCGPYIAI